MKTIDFSIPKGAIFSEDRKYRYALWRVWNYTNPLLVIGLNPSTANEISDDPTITRCIARAAKLGYGSFIMANLYAYVSTDPKVLLTDGECIGEENDDYLKYMVRLAGKVLCGWGSFIEAKKRAGAVLKMIPTPYCLGINSDGSPKHPLYVGYDVPLVKYRVEVRIEK